LVVEMLMKRDRGSEGTVQPAAAVHVAAPLLPPATTGPANEVYAFCVLGRYIARRRPLMKNERGEVLRLVFGRAQQHPAPVVACALQMQRRGSSCSRGTAAGRLMVSIMATLSAPSLVDQSSSRP
jgi:hypothetical protein